MGGFSLKDVFFIGIALAMDALALTLSISIMPKIRYKSKIIFVLSFAFFQFLFSFLGGIQGKLFCKYIVCMPQIFSGITILILGIIMLINSFKRDDEDETFLVTRGMYIILGITVSIDALVVAFTNFNHQPVLLTFLYTVIIGLITLVACLFGVFASKYLSKFKLISNYSDLIGGLILIGLGIRMIFSYV